ncbi:site-specific integrase [Labilibacter marinus]|uniref:site-specific integrase n=1 Tax=Labilibacter marinus TaxID=1477105 RepID=UPI00095018C2|nr:site-specific integrase [Labilibacter marinus]
MSNNQLLYVKFFLRTTKKSPEMGMVYLRISYNTKRVDFTFNHRVKVSSWDSKNDLVKSSEKDYLRINRAITSARTKILGIYERLRYEEKLITPEILKKLYLGNKEESKTLLYLMDYHNESQASVLSYGTLKNYFTTQKYLAKYLNNVKRVDDIYLQDLNYQFITEFDAYLRNYKPLDHHKPLTNNGIMKHLERLRKVTSMAVRLEWLEKDPFEKYKFSFTKVDREYLTEKELDILKNRTFSIERLQYVKDLFVFSCYAGLSYIDVQQLKQDNLILGIDGEYWIQTVRQKTEMVVNIPILPVALGIINKYKDHPRAIHNGTVFPKLSNQKLNSYLKEVADICGIKKVLTFHIARHTFATTVTLSNGVPIETVSKVLGHSNLSTTMIYARVLKNKISEDMNTLKATLQEKESKPIKRKKYNT